MSDSDEELMPNNILNYQHNPAANNATNFNNTHITSYSFRNNMMTSTFNMPHLDRQRYGMRGFDQRSMYYRRETSPMSLRSFPDSGILNLHNTLRGRGMSSQRSVFNGRSGSPMSMRSIDSNASVSAADIALAFKNVKFNKYDLRLIKDAYNKFMKNRIRKRIEKRRNLKLFLKGNRRRSGDDSGEQGSDSSISSDGCRSSRTIIHKENIPKSIHRPMKTQDLTHFRTLMTESDMYKDCTDNLKQNSLRNKFPVNTLSHNHTVPEEIQNASVLTLKDRFTKGSFQLPSERFNKSKVNHVITNKHGIPDNSRYKNNHCISVSNRGHESDSERDEIFSENTIKANNINRATAQRKRALDAEETQSSEKKKNKTAISPIKQHDTTVNSTNMEKSDFTFKKPIMPIRKSSNVKKDTVPERLIAKSRQPLTGNLELELQNVLSNDRLQSNPYLEHRQTTESQETESLRNTIEMESDTTNQTETTQNTTDVSMKPSFMKRKLFTQKLDVAESKNISSDNLASNSPQTTYKECKEKNKVRKLVSSQSCLSRDVLGDDNVLDLIHKIVPPDQMNITSAMNRKESCKNNDNDRWDVASVISMCNNDEGSDTYTDEEIFKVSQMASKTINKPVTKADKLTTTKDIEAVAELHSKNHKINTECKVVVQKLPSKINSMKQPDVIKVKEAQCQNKRTVSHCVKSFWDTDFESDIEERSAPWSSKCQVTQGKDVLKDTTNDCTNLNLNKRNTLKGTILTVRSFQNKGINISRVSRRKNPEEYPEKREENNNKMLNTSKSYKKNEKDVKDHDLPSAKPQKSTNTKNELTKSKNEKCNPKQTKESKIKQNFKENNDCNTSRESQRLKEKKKEKSKINKSLQMDGTRKRGRPPKSSIDKTNDEVQKKTQPANKKSKETFIKDNKPVKNPTVKNATLNRTRTPRKCNEKKQLSSSTEQSSLNISNMSTRSLRIRRKVIK